MNVERGTRKRKRFVSGARKRFKPSLEARVRKIEKVIEKKYFDFALKATESTGGYTRDGSIHYLNFIPEGTGMAERVGDKLFLESVQLRLHATVEETNGLAGVRTILLYDQRGVTGALSAADFMDYSKIIDGEEYLAPLAVGNMDDVTVLFDDTNGASKDSWVQVTTSGTSASLATRTELTINAYRKIRRPTRYTGDSNQPRSGTLVLLLIGNQWASATANPANRVALVTRVKYTDA